MKNCIFPPPWRPGGKPPMADPKAASLALHVDHWETMEEAFEMEMKPHGRSQSSLKHQW